MQDMNYLELLEHCTKQVNLDSQRSFFERKTLTAKVMKDINRVNSGKDGDRRHWKHDHLLQGFWNAKGPAFIRDQTPILSTDEYVTLFAYTKTLCGLQMPSSM